MRRVRSFAVHAATVVLLTGLIVPIGVTAVMASGETFPGTNGRILYFSRVHRVAQVFSVKPNGSGARQLTDLKHGTYIATATADGRTIAFESDGDIWTMSADGSGKRRLRAHGYDIYPAISPDGRHIAYMHSNGAVFDLFVMRSNGTGRHVVAHDGGHQATAPDWSPDGSTIAFTFQPLSGVGGHIDTVWPDGTHLQRVGIDFSPDTIHDAIGASWSPDGSTFAFFAQPLRHGTPTCDVSQLYECQELYTVNSAGGVPARLTHDRLDDYYPIWSPDGTQITYSHDSTDGGCKLFENDCRFDVFAMNADGTDPHKVTGTRRADDEPVWWMVS
jgi:Tol biopolymer transport system component